MYTVELDDFEILILLSGIKRVMRNNRLYASGFGNAKAEVLYKKLEQLQSERDSNVS